MKPSLILNKKQLVDLRLLEDTKITLKIHNELDNLTTSQVYDKLALTDNEDFVIEFSVPANLHSITVELSSKVNVRHYLNDLILMKDLINNNLYR